MNSEKIKNKLCQPNGFTIKESIALVIVLALFYVGFIKGIELASHWKVLENGMLRLAVGILSGSILVLVFMFSCMGIGAFLAKRRDEINGNGD